MRCALALVVVAGCSFAMDTVRSVGPARCDDSKRTIMLDAVGLGVATALTTVGLLRLRDCGERGGCFAAEVPVTIGIIIGVPYFVAIPVGVVRADQCHRAKRDAMPVAAR